MNFDLIHIIISVALIIFIIISTLLFFSLKNKKKQTKKIIEKAKIKFLKEEEYLQKEIQRQNFIIEDFRKRNGKYVSKDKENNKQINNELNIENNNQIRSKISDNEQNQFTEKNKKLWELSTAIHKEKNKIDKLRKQVEYRHNEVTKSITYAQRIQKALLPSSEQLDACIYEHFVLWRPRDIVSGDFYWTKQIGNFSIIVVADCTGHGVPGALMSVLGISFLNEIFASGKMIRASEILEKMRKLIKNALHQNESNFKKIRTSDGIDMAVCIINNQTLDVNFAGANNPLFLIRNNGLKVFKANRNPVGIHPFEKPFTDYDYKLQKNDRLFMFSDGFIDQFGGDGGRKFLSKNFKNLLLLISSQNFTMEKEKEILDNALDDWKGPVNQQIDDILIFGIKI
ncbi:MAG: SpoIIE family protein phosphatase [Bacteroidales bacterium]|nr:SpoIIE family protein phosphatase [Bacteroidales bacterium]MBN2758450.1 SpoIIE family protein phosphatase [Bacteroidales bacterium]